MSTHTEPEEYPAENYNNGQVNENKILDFH